MTFDEFQAIAKSAQPKAGFILGSGLTAITDNVAVRASISFGDIPGFAASTVSGHAGKLSLCEWVGQPILLFQGRLHFYEGHPWERVTRPVAVAAELGVRNLILTNAAGGIREDLVPGRLMAIRDHYLWNRPYFWQQPGNGGVGGERPSPYSPELLKILQTAANTVGVDWTDGVYASLTGPTYETPAEIRALRTCGADAVGMSTAFEIQTAANLGLNCAAVSVITNKAAGLSDGPLNHGEVLHAAKAAGESLARVLARGASVVSVELTATQIGFDERDA